MANAVLASIGAWMMEVTASLERGSGQAATRLRAFARALDLVLEGGRAKGGAVTPTRAKLLGGDRGRAPA